MRPINLMPQEKRCEFCGKFCARLFVSKNPMIYSPKYEPIQLFLCWKCHEALVNEIQTELFGTEEIQ